MSDDENNAYIRGLKDALEGIDDPYLHEEGKKTRYEQGFIAGVEAAKCRIRVMIENNEADE